MKVLALSVKPVLPQMGVVQQGIDLHPLVMVLECCGQTLNDLYRKLKGQLESVRKPVQSSF
jgi:hypothetical protein